MGKATFKGNCPTCGIALYDKPYAVFTHSCNENYKATRQSEADKVQANAEPKGKLAQSPMKESDNLAQPIQASKQTYTTLAKKVAAIMDNESDNTDSGNINDGLEKLYGKSDVSDNAELDEILANVVNEYKVIDRRGGLDITNFDVVADKAKAQIAAYTNKQVVAARVDEVLQMRAVGDRYVATNDVSFEGLSGAYDAHILKRAADLTGPELKKGDS